MNADVSSVASSADAPRENSEDMPLREKPPVALVLGGATGMLGQALTRAAAAKGWDVHTLGREDGPVTDPAFLEDALSRMNPDYIFNGIAYTAVDLAESEKERACALNRAFPALLGGMTRGSGAHLIHFSTDFVFNGKKRAPYTEDDAADPLNVYGASKLAGEQALAALDMPNCCVVRTAWLFGPGRRNFVSVMLDMARDEDTKRTITVVHDQVGSPTYTVDLAAMSLALAVKRASGIVHAVNTGQASWCELASEAVGLVKPDARIQPISSGQWPQKARRPSYSVLSTARLTELTGMVPRPWPQALRDKVIGIYASETPGKTS